MLGGSEAMIPDLAEPISAWRCWIISGDKDTPVLLSPRQQITWPPVGGWDSHVIRGAQRNFVTARCNERSLINRDGPGCKECPSPDGDNHYGVGCGLYGYKEIGDLAWDFPLNGLSRYRTGVWRPLDIPVWGKVLLWGRVYEHNYGYRAQYGRVESLVTIEGLPNASWSRVIDNVANFYGVPHERLGERTIWEIEEHVLERTIAEDQAVLRAFQNFGVTLRTAMDDVVSKMLQWGAAFKEIAEQIEKFSQSVEKAKKAEEDAEEGEEDG